MDSRARACTCGPRWWGTSRSAWAGSSSASAHRACRPGSSTDISVDQGHRGKGHGRALLDALHDAARALGATSMTLNVFGDNATAIRLYESSGYAVTAQQMKKEL